MQARIRFFCAFIFVSAIRVSISLSAQVTTDTIYERAEVLPQFQGGVDAMNRLIRANLRYPEAAIDSNIQGKVWIRFIVGIDGRVSGAEILKSAHPLFNSAALDVVNRMPPWTPGRMNGQVINCKATIPIEFELETVPDLPYPTFKKGSFRAFITKNLSYPSKALHDRIGGLCRMDAMIDISGKIERINITQSAEKSLDSEAVRLLRLTEWYPAIQEGKQVAQKISVPIYFSPLFAEMRKYSLIQAEDHGLSRVPEFGEGMDEYLRYLIRNTRLYISNSSSQNNALELIRMKVTSEGMIEDITIKKSLGKAFDDESLRLIREMPRWEPGIKTNKPVDSYVQLAVVFNKKTPANESSDDWLEPMHQSNNHRFMNFDSSPNTRVIVIGPRGNYIDFQH